MRYKQILKLNPRKFIYCFLLRRSEKVRSEQVESKTQTEMFSNASVIAEIGGLDTTSPFSSRKHPDLGKDSDTFSKLTDTLVLNKD